MQTKQLITEAFISGDVVLYQTAQDYPQMRMIPIDRLDAVRAGLNRLGYIYRTRYRGPHRPQHDTLKRDARAFTIYFKEQQ